MLGMKKEVPIWEKYTLNVEEASKYYGIGMKSLYEIIHNNPNADFLLEIGSHYRIKRVKFEMFLDETKAL
ncbi:MAG: transposase [Lachnospiraceae bacterium]|nr:transposase [Lachnospiraceae bacterium]